MNRTRTTWRGTALILLAGMAAACDGGGTGSRPPSAVTPTTPVTMTATVGTLVGSPPAVRVVDDQGRGLSNVAVTFAVTSGGGIVTGAAATTNADGVAAAGSWILGPVAGPNTLTATVGNLPPATFTATGTAGAPSTVAKVSGDLQTGVVGSTLPQPLVVRVTDAHSNPTPGVTVSFTVTSGGGTVGTASAATDAQGLASTTHLLGPQSGSNNVRVTAAGLPPVGFTATAQAGPPAAIAKAAGDNQQARSGTAVPVPPAVIVTDANGNPVPGVAVTFAVASGGGSVTGAVATTSATGRATVGSWTLGAVGTNTLTASAGSAGTVTFTAIAISGGADPCTNFAAFTLRTTVNGSLAAGDCSPSPGDFVDFYTTSTSSALVEEFRLTSTSYNPLLFLFDASGRLVAFDDDGAGSRNSSIRVLGPPGQYFLAATSSAPGETGTYQLSSRALPPRSSCLEAWVVPGVSISGSLASGDCPVASGAYADLYFVYLEAGQQITIVQRSTAFNSYLVLGDASTGSPVVENDNGAGGNDARIAYTAPRDGPYFIYARSLAAGQTGAYTLSVTSVGGQAALRAGPDGTIMNGLIRPRKARLAPIR